MVCFKDRTNYILREHHANIQFDEKMQIIKSALKFICNDIATTDLQPKLYHSANTVTDIPSQLALLPESLGMFLKSLLNTDEWVATWGQNFIMAYRRRSGVVSYRMGLAIQMDNRFGYKWLRNKLHRLGYTESDAETKKYKYCFLNDTNEVRICDGSGTPVTNIEEIDVEIDDKVEIDGISVLMV